MKRPGASTAFSAFEYIGKAACTYLLYYYLRSDLGGILSLAGEPGAAGAGAGAEYSYKESSSATTFSASEGAADAAPPFSGGYATGGGYNAAAPASGGYQN